MAKMNRKTDGHAKNKVLNARVVSEKYQWIHRDDIKTDVLKLTKQGILVLGLATHMADFDGCVAKDKLLEACWKHGISKSSAIAYMDKLTYNGELWRLRHNTLQVSLARNAITTTLANGNAQCVITNIKDCEGGDRLIRKITVEYAPI